MTSIPNTGPIAVSGAGTQARPSPTAAQPTAVQFGSLDPVKLLNKHKWLLMGAGVLGIGVGVVSHYALARFMPSYKAAAIYHCMPPTASAASDPTLFMNEIEMNRFMATQARTMMLDTVLRRVVEDPAVRRNETEPWARQFVDGTGRFNTEDALESLRDMVNARIISGTTFIELSATHKNRYVATKLTTMVREKYSQFLRSQGTATSEERQKSLRDQIDRLEREANVLATSRGNLIRNESLSSIEDRAQTDQIELAGINAELLRVIMQREATIKLFEQMTAELNSPAGITFSDDLREEVERDPLVAGAKQSINGLESMRLALINDGYSPEHREMRRIDNQIRGYEGKLEDMRSRLLRERFNSKYEQVRQLTVQLDAQKLKLEEDRRRLTERVTNLTRIAADIRDIDSKINSLLANKAEANSQLQNLLSVADLSSSSRVVLQQAETVPNSMAFPKLAFMIPAGFFLIVGLTGGVVLLRELMDQRVKGPSDISIIPRTRLLGWVPDASEDPAGAGAAETAFRDRPRGVVAESFRQVRAAIAKRMEQAGHRTLLVMSGMPGSGSTTVASNLALAFAAADERVLLIDANFRRPGVHKVFGVQEGPGLAELLRAGDTSSLEQTVQKTNADKLDVLTAGGRDGRHVERLSTDSMSALLEYARSRYDLVIIETAPAIVAGDGVALSHRCDASLLVVKAFAEKRGLVARVKNELTDSRGEFLGVLVNSVRGASGGYMRGNIRAAAEYQQS